jgi:ribonucleoside-diphosphate reductase alpha chain
LYKDTLDFFHGDKLRAALFLERYALTDRFGRPTEKTPREMWSRVAKAVSAAEIGQKERRVWRSRFTWLLKNFRFIPGGRIMYGAGRFGNITLLSDYVTPIKDDSIEAVFECIKEMALTFKYGGCTGTDISILRPKGAAVHNAAAYSNGAVSFMTLMNETTHTISQSGRHSALMITIRVDHPDIFDFIQAKRDVGAVRYANLSVMVTDAFMKAVEGDKDFLLHYENPTVGVINRTVKARSIWNEIISSARDCGEPGLIFWDTVKRMSPSEYNGMQVVTTNACAEQPLEPHGGCPLGALNLSLFVEDSFRNTAHIEWVALEKSIRYAVRFLDDVITSNGKNHALPQQVIAVSKSRRIGLGVTGFADMLAKMRIKYDTKDALDFASGLFSRIKTIAYDADADLAREKGTFPMFDADKHLAMPFIQSLGPEICSKISRFGLRNVCILTVAPVGGGSVLAGTSSGIEPIYDIEYARRSESLSAKHSKIVHPLVTEYVQKYGADGGPLPSFFVSAHGIDSLFRVRMQGVIQKQIDSAISSTVNLPEDATTHDVDRVFFQAWKEGCKGITVYREGSREDILRTRTKDNEHQGRKPAQTLASS